MKIICPECQSKGKKSNSVPLTPETISSTATESYYDENGDIVGGSISVVQEVRFLCSEGHLYSYQATDGVPTSPLALKETMPKASAAKSFEQKVYTKPAIDKIPSDIPNEK
jgi:hypothetical protein